MREARLTLLGSIAGLVGIALLLFEATHAISGAHVLSSVAQLLMWVGLGIAAIGGLLLVIASWSAASDATAPDPDQG